MTLVTQTIGQLPAAAAVSANALTVVQEPGGTAAAVPVKRLLGRLISTDEATATRAELNALLGYAANSLALVFADPDPAKNGWYRKTGASGAGGWTMFEQLSAAAVAQVQASLAAVETTLEQLASDAQVAAEKRDIIPCTAASRVAGGTTYVNQVVLTPKEGYVIAAGSELRFSFLGAATNNGTVTIDVVGFTNGDQRQLLLPSTEQVPAGLVRQGGYTEIKYLPNAGQFVLITPTPTYSSYVTLLQVNGDPAFFQCVMRAGTVLFPGSPTFLIHAPADRLAGEFNGVILEVDGFNNGDPRQVVYPDGSQIGGNAWRAGSRLTVAFDAPSGKFVMSDPLPPAQGASEYQLIALAHAHNGA